MRRRSVDHSIERYPPPLEVNEREGMYVLVDDGPPEEWWYLFVPRNS